MIIMYEELKSTY